MHYPASTSALVLIDMANDFVYAGGVIADAGGPDYQQRAQAILPRLAALVQAAREVGVVVIYATDAHNPGDAELTKWPPHAMKGTRWAEVVPQLAPQPEDLVIEKTTYSPFVSSDIGDKLRERGVKRLYIAGLHTDCCARHASGDAFQLGYDLIWITDGLQAFTEQAHLDGLEYFKAWYATDPQRQLCSSADVIAAWQR